MTWVRYTCMQNAHKHTTPHTLITMWCKQSATFGVPIFSAGHVRAWPHSFSRRCQNKCHFCGTSFTREWKSVILTCFGGEFLSQSRREDTCWLRVVIILLCYCILSLFWISSWQGLRETTETALGVLLTLNGWLKVWSQLICKENSCVISLPYQVNRTSLWVVCNSCIIKFFVWYSIMLVRNFITQWNSLVS